MHLRNVFFNNVIWSRACGRFVKHQEAAVEILHLVASQPESSQSFVLSFHQIPCRVFVHHPSMLSSTEYASWSRSSSLKLTFFVFFFILALCLPELCLLLCAWLGEPRGEAKGTGWEQCRQHPFSSRSWALGWHESRWVLPERGACFYPPVVCFGCRLGHDLISRNHTYCWVIDEGSLPPNVVRQRLGPFSPFLWRRRRG